MLFIMLGMSIGILSCLGLLAVQHEMYLKIMTGLEEALVTFYKLRKPGVMRFFKVQELVPREVFKARGEAAIELMDKRVLQALDDLRAVTKYPMTVNDKTHQFRGLRTPDCREFSPYSQHTFGRAVDAVSVLKPEAYHREILTNLDKYPGVTFIEVDITGFTGSFSDIS